MMDEEKLNVFPSDEPVEKPLSEDPPVPELGEEDKLPPVERQKARQSKVSKRFSEYAKQRNDAWDLANRALKEKDEYKAQLASVQDRMAGLEKKITEAKDPYQGYSSEELERAAFSLIREQDPEKASENEDKAFRLFRESRKRGDDRIKRELRDEMISKQKNQDLRSKGEMAYRQAAALIGKTEKYVDVQTNSYPNTQEVSAYKSIMRDLEKEYGNRVDEFPPLRAFAVMLGDRQLEAYNQRQKESEKYEKDADLLRSRTEGQISVKGETTPKSVGPQPLANKRVDDLLGELSFIKEDKAKRKLALKLR